MAARLSREDSAVMTEQPMTMKEALEYMAKQAVGFGTHRCIGVVLRYDNDYGDWTCGFEYNDHSYVWAVSTAGDPETTVLRAAKDAASFAASQVKP